MSIIQKWDDKTLVVLSGQGRCVIVKKQVGLRLVFETLRGYDYCPIEETTAISLVSAFHSIIHYNWKSNQKS